MTPLDRLIAELTGGGIVTDVLERRCGGRLRAVVDRAAVPPPGGERLGAAVAYRRVRLMHDATTLSVADNWYVPERLTADMRHALDGDVPFGRAIAALCPRRRTLSVMREAGDAVLEIRALVIAEDDALLAEVVERYAAAALIDRSDRPGARR